MFICRYLDVLIQHSGVLLKHSPIWCLPLSQHLVLDVAEIRRTVASMSRSARVGRDGILTGRSTVGEAGVDVRVSKGIHRARITMRHREHCLRVVKRKVFRVWKLFLEGVARCVIP